MVRLLYPIRPALAGLILCAATTTGCKSTCGTFIGDRSKPLEGVLIAFANGQGADLPAGGVVSLEQPPQGGYVIYVGARLRNLAACQVDFQGQLRDPIDGHSAGFDRRQSNLVAGVDGWARPEMPEISNVPNVNPCPDYATHDVNERVLTLEMKITDPEGRSLQLSTPVLPRCQQSDPAHRANCVCTCSANYFLGKCGLGDGGDPNHD